METIENKPTRIDINRASGGGVELAAVVKDMFEYHSWSEGQKELGAKVRHALELACLAIIEFVPPCPDRTVAIRKLREARMDCNSAITHQGKY